MELVVHFLARGSTQVLLCLCPGVLLLRHFLYSVGPHPVSNLHIHVYTFVVLRAFMAGAASQAGDADSSRAPVLTSALQWSVNVHRGALLLVPQWQCISSFVFYIFVTLVPFAMWSWQCSSPRRVRLKCYYAFVLVFCCCDTSYIVSLEQKHEVDVRTATFYFSRDRFFVGDDDHAPCTLFGINRFIH